MSEKKRLRLLMVITREGKGLICREYIDDGDKRHLRSTIAHLEGREESFIDMIFDYATLEKAYVAEPTKELKAEFPDRFNPLFHKTPIMLADDPEPKKEG